MTLFESWLKACKEMGDEVWRLEESGNFRLYKLVRKIGTGYMRTSYHVWNTESGEWETYADYRQALDCYKRMCGNC